jgi:pimeloyl-ACP methyl ester carboxylesterase
MTFRRGMAAVTILAGAGCASAPKPLLCGTPPVVEQLTLQSRDASLRAVLHRPDAPGRHAAVVLVHGSGPMTADQMLRWTSQRFIDMGIAVLAYDKRGVGGSSGTYSVIGPANSDHMFSLLADDALAGIAALKAMPAIDGTQLGLFGNSQGGWIAPVAAARSSDVGFFISLSGPAVTVGEENAYSFLAGADPGSRQGLSDAEIETQFAAFTGPHGFDPMPVLRTLATPSLWIVGEHDRSIPVKRTLENLEMLARDEGRPITVHTAASADHGMRVTGSGRPYDFWTPLRDWLQARLTVRPCAR